MSFFEITKNVSLNLAHRLRPRATFRWIFSAVVWAIILAYISLGVYFGIHVYKNDTSKLIKMSANFYPFPAVMVNGKVVWASDYFKQLGYIEQFTTKSKDISYIQSDIRTKIINNLIENEIIEFQALRYNIRVGNKDFNDAYQQILAQGGGQSDIKKVLRDLYDMSEPDFKVLVRQQILKEKIRNELMLQVKVSHMFIKDENRAKEVVDKLAKGEKFEDLAKVYSEDVKSRDNGGDLGWLSKGQLVVDNAPLVEFDNAAFSAKIGQVVGPIKTGSGFEVIRVDGKKGLIAENFSTWLENTKKHSSIWRFIK